MKNLRSLLGLLIIASIVYVGWKVGPVYFANFQLEEAMDDSARDAVFNLRRSEQDIRDKLAKQVRELDIPLSPDDIQIQRGTNDVFIWAEYTVHVDLPVYPLDLHFQPASKSKKRLGS